MNASFCSINVIFLQPNQSHRITAPTKLPLKKFLSSKFSVRTHKLPKTNRTQTAVHEDAHSSLLEDSKTSLTVFNFTIEEANLVLKKAFGWNHSPYRGEERIKEAPQLDSIEEMLDYLKSLSLSDDDLHKIIKMFPEVLGCSLSEELPAIVLVTVNTPCYLFFHQTSSIFGPFQWESSRMRKRAGISSVQNYL
ncbi:hypothetical protein KSP40_PGU013987 [Platanthera guangdongensis]|uniref:Uncharacterized protein n=1 Tax=Platanthera guangdongensis TaxID=2320717 RepID=A0ABR2MBL2_9ASPA